MKTLNAFADARPAARLVMMRLVMALALQTPALRHAKAARGQQQRLS
jgi:hypothetical protein